jgi:hypothetical protein
MPRFIALDRRAVRQMKPGEKRREHGIYVERLADGDFRYGVAFMTNGQRIHRVIGLASEGVTRTQAEEYITRVKAEARTGRLQLPKGRKLALSFADAARQYLARLQRSGGKNLKTKGRQMRMYLVPHFGSIRLDAMTEFSIETYKTPAQGAGRQQRHDQS